MGRMPMPHPESCISAQAAAVTTVTACLLRVT
jgi:hypothetical protein